MTDLLAGAKIRAADWPTSVTTTEGTLTSNITDVVFVTGAPVVDRTFVAPTTGRVLIHIAAGMRDNTNNNRVIVAYELYLGTSAAGTLIVSTVSTLATEVSSPGEADDLYYVGRTSLVQDLVPGSTYYVRIMYKSETAIGASADLSRRDITVRPVP